MADGAVGAQDRLVTVPASPASAEVRDRVREARARGTPLRIVGGATWLDAGRPVVADGRLELGGLRGVVEYTPGDLTLTALAGTTLGEIAELTRREGQWLALDPVGGADGTLGATIATASAGPVSHAVGTPRDNVLGVEFVTGAGDTVRGGGRVVKNVAGFDLTRLVTGAWGTLGAITEVTVRLRALPAVDETVALAVPDDPRALEARLRAVRDAPLAPLALELLDDATARRVGVGDGTMLLARLAGNQELVRAQRRTLGDLGAVQAIEGDVWTRLAAPEAMVTCSVRLSSAPARMGETWRLARSFAGAVGGRAQATIGRGVVRVVADGPEAALRDGLATLRAARVTVIVERLPSALWAQVAPSAVNDRLSRGVRRAFDPDRILNPGIFGEAPA